MHKQFETSFVYEPHGDGQTLGAFTNPAFDTGLPAPSPAPPPVGWMQHSWDFSSIPDLSKGFWTAVILPPQALNLVKAAPFFVPNEE